METYLTEDPLKTTRLIGQMCKCGNAFSLLVLIGREAWPQNNLHNRFEHFYVLISKLMPQSFFGGDSKEETPVPIPNTEVKLFCADGTAWEAKWESRTLPKNFYTARNHQLVSNVIPGFYLIL